MGPMVRDRGPPGQGQDAAPSTPPAPGRTVAAMRLLLALLLTLAALPAWAVTELKIATWNVAWFTLRAPDDRDLPRNLTPRNETDFARLRAYADRLAADVLALQEVDGPEAAARLLNPREYEFHFPDERDIQRAGFAWRRGLNVTRNPDLAGLDLRPHARFSLRRGADITVETRGGSRLRLLSVHLNAGCMEDALESSNRRECESLGQQASVLAGWIAERRRDGIPFMILGDFNRRIRRDDSFVRVLEQHGPLLRANEGVSNPCWTGERGGRPFIDHILLGGAARGWMVEGSLRVLIYAERDPAMRDRLSDHCPLSLRMRLP